MGMYIKGMKTPDHCWECWLMRNLICGASGELIPSSGKLKHCPLVDLGKHGDLIDKNSLKETLDYYIREAGWGEEINKALGWVKDDFINSEPTLIEAEDEA